MSKNRPVNAVTANFKTNMRQMTEVSQRKKNRLEAIVGLHLNSN